MTKNYHKLNFKHCINQQYHCFVKYEVQLGINYLHGNPDPILETKFSIKFDSTLKFDQSHQSHDLLWRL